MSKKERTLEQCRKEAQIIKNQFDACYNFKESKNILLEAKRAVDFFEGRQWVDNNSKFPFEKPVANIIQTIIDAKVASINQKTYKINFVIDNDQLTTNKVTRFGEFQMKEMEQNELNYQATYDGLVKGTYIYYYFWDKDAVGQNGDIEGALRAQIIDIEDIAVANPNEKDVQKQEWIILRTRESVKSIKENCTMFSEKELNELIIKDNVKSAYTDNIEQDYEPTCYSYTKFFRQDGEVYFEKATEHILYQEPTSMNPLTNEEAIKLSKKEKENDEHDEVYDKDPVSVKDMSIDSDLILSSDMDYSMERKFKALYYPFEINSFYRRNNCIFGRSLAYQIIPIQKVINQLIATNILIAVKTAMPTLLIKQGALGTSNVDLSKPGGILVDRSVGTNGWGITSLNTGTLTTAHFELAQNLIAMIKDIFKATDILDDGRGISSKMSGYAMSQLQTIQDKPIAQLQEILSRSIGREGRILEMFYKLFYHNKQFSYSLTDTELLQANPEAQDVTQLPRTQADVFEGEDYLNTPFNVSVDVEETAKSSELMLVSVLETLFLNGTIEKLSPETLMMYAELVPSYYFSKKDEFKRLIQQKLNSRIEQLTQENQQLMAQLQQAGMAVDAMKSEFNNKIAINNENNRSMEIGFNQLQKAYSNLQKEYEALLNKSQTQTQ